MTGSTKGPTPEAALRVAADAFHKIMAAHGAARLLGRQGQKMTQPIRDGLAVKCLTPDQVEKIAADGFEQCVLALAELGAESATVHECGERR